MIGGAEAPALLQIGTGVELLFHTERNLLRGTLSTFDACEGRAHMHGHWRRLVFLIGSGRERNA